MYTLEGVLQTSLLIMKSLSKTATPFSNLCSLFPENLRASVGYHRMI